MAIYPIYGSGGGGSNTGGGVAAKATVLQLGATPATSHTVTVIDVDVTPSSKVLVSSGVMSDADSNDDDMDPITFRAIPQSGQFTLLVTSQGPVLGEVKIFYLVTE